MKCPTCGRENRGNAGYCAWCGSRLSAPASQETGSGATADKEAPPLSTATATDIPALEAPARAPGDLGPPAALATPDVEDQEQAGSQEEPQAEEAPPAVALATSPATVDQPPNDLGDESPGTPFRPGDVLAKHYEIVELLESTPERNVYRARDLERCASCGYDDNLPGDEYCRNCGASLEKPAYVRITEEVRRKPEAYDLKFSEDERDYYVNIESQPEPPSVASPNKLAPLRLVWGRATDKGQQRDVNEDTLEVWVYAKGSGGVVGLFVVADGLGGQDSGEVASRLTTDTIWQSLRESVWQPILRGEALDTKELGKHVKEAVAAANQVVYSTRLERKSEMSSTVTLALVIDGQAVIGNVGDSRTYLWNAAGLRRITKDHSLVQRLVDTGQITPQEVYSHPQRNLIYQSIGDRPQVQVDVFDHPLAPDDHIILCSDGLWEMVHDEGLEEILLAEPDLQRACDRLVQNANLAGGDDNISVIIVRALAA